MPTRRGCLRACYNPQSLRDSSFKKELLINKFTAKNLKLPQSAALTAPSMREPEKILLFVQDDHKKGALRANTVRPYDIADDNIKTKTAVGKPTADMSESEIQVS